TLRLAFKRASIPLSYSRGFHPQPQISFGPALPLTVESKEEFIDFYTYRYFLPEECLKRLNESLPPEMGFLKVIQISREAASLSTLVTGSDYSVNLADPAIESVINNFASRKEIPLESCHQFAIDTFHAKPEILITKHKSAKVVDIKKFVRSLSLDESGQRLLIEMKIENGATVGIQNVVKALYEIDVEFPVTRERQYIWCQGAKQSPLNVESDQAALNRQLLDMMI
ncbi:TIGR03936 family radical SAM-associated protein, partial [bacterium]|nr:TIGR03936 family radical SAM-associated protein [bacterium]